MWSFRRASGGVAFTAAAIAVTGISSTSAETEPQLSVAATVTGCLQDLQPVLLDVRLNGDSREETLMVLRSGTCPALYLPAAFFLDRHVRIDEAAMLHRDGADYIALGDLKGVTFNLDAATQTLTLNAAPELFSKTRVNLQRDDPGPMTPSSYGGFLNYDILGELAGGHGGVNASLELGAFTPHGVGVASFVGRLSDHGARFVRLETSWTIDDPSEMRSLRIGDSVTAGGPAEAPLRFAGLQFARNFAVDPGYVTFPTPSVGGSAALPSTVDIFVNNVRRQQQTVQPGPFQIVNIPVVTGEGDINLVVHDMLGREVVINQSYYAAPELLRPGLFDFSYEAGALRKGFGERSDDYGALFVAGSQRYGVTDGLTVSSRVEVSQKVQSAGGQLAILLPHLGLASLGAAASHASDGTGVLASASFERRARSFSFGVDAELTTADFRTLDSFMARERVRLVARAFIGAPTPFGSVGASYIRRDARDTSAADYLSVNSSIRIRRLGSLSVTARRNVGGQSDYAVQAFFTLPIGERTHASLDAGSDDGERYARADVQRSLPVGDGWGYRASATTGSYQRLDGELDVQTGAQTIDVDAVATGRQIAARASVSGALGLIDGTLFASRRLDQSFAAVHVGDYENVRVYVDNQLVGRTNQAGVAIVPELRPYDRNNVRIDLTDLPIDAQAPVEELAPRPYGRSGISLDFGVRRSRGAILRIVLENGAPLPDGSAVQLNGSAQAFISAGGGELYVTDAGASNLASAHYGDATCTFGFNLPEGTDPQPHLGAFVCRRVRM